MYFLIKLPIFLLFVVIFNSYADETTQRGDFIGEKESEIPAWFYQSFLDLKEDVEDSKKENKNLIIYFHQKGCPYCHLIIEKNFKNKKTKTKILRSFNVLEINIWGDREITDFNGEILNEKEFALIHKVQFTPTLLFFDEEGKQVLRINGYLSLAEFNLALDFISQKKYQELDFAEFKHKLIKTPKRKSLISEPIFAKPPFILLQNKKSKPLMIIFERKACKNCEAFHNEILRNKDTLKYLPKFKVIQLDAQANTKIITPKNQKTTSAKWAKKLKINYFPTVVFFDNKGDEIIKSEAMFKFFHFQSIIKYVQSGAYKTQPQFQRYLSDRAEQILETGKNVNIWK